LAIVLKISVTKIVPEIKMTRIIRTELIPLIYIESLQTSTLIIPLCCINIQPNIEVNKLRKMRQVGHVARMVDMRNSYKLLITKSEAKYCGGIVVERCTIINYILRKQGIWICSRYILGPRPSHGPVIGSY
jgi:hypothetical protein